MKNRMKRKQRRAAAMILCLVLIVFLTALSGIVIKTVLDDRRESRTEMLRQQARLLLQDGLHRAEMRRKAEPEFSGETLEIPSESSTNTGTYILTSVYDGDDQAFRIDVRFRDRVGNIIVTRKQ